MMEDFLDQHENMNIRCVLTGHTHKFSAYQRKAVAIIIAPSCGGMMVLLPTAKRLELHGPLENGRGAEHHLATYNLEGAILMELGEQITYSFIGVEGERIWEHEQKY